MRIAVLQHVGFEGPGAIADWAASRRHDLLAVAGKAELAEGDDQVQPAERLLSEAPQHAAALRRLLETCMDAWGESGRR